jgi:hypothetical protein
MGRVINWGSYNKWDVESTSLVEIFETIIKQCEIKILVTG